MLQVLGRKTSGNVQKVIWLLEEMKQPYEREDYGRQFGNTGGDYLKLNPNGKVPTLVDGDVVVWESNTILRYLGNKHGGSFYPADPAARSHVERWMDWQLATLNSPYLAIFRDAKKPAAERSAWWISSSSSASVSRPARSPTSIFFRSASSSLHCSTPWMAASKSRAPLVMLRAKSRRPSRTSAISMFSAPLSASRSSQSTASPVASQSISGIVPAHSTGGR